jgi:FAD/FMN-containing dehydrogenase
MTLTGTSIIDDLRQRVHGPVLAAGDPDFDTARALWNGAIDRHPAAVVRCSGAADVIATLDLADRHALPVTVRSGGHGVAGRAVRDGAVLIDLSLLDDVHVDPTRRRARVGPGATWGTFDRETQAFGLATTGGVHSGTGVGGLALGGGIGYLARAHGLTVDNIVSANLVLADGRLVTASEDQHPDLFWALRGAGANLGVVTELELALHEVGPEVMTAQAYVGLDAAPDALRAYRAIMADASDELSVYALVIKVPPIDDFPTDRHGTVALALVACHCGDLADAEAAVAPVAELPQAFLAFAAPMPYAGLQSAFDAGSPDGGRYYWKSRFLGGLDDALIDDVVAGIGDMPGDMSMVFFEPLGGAVNRVDPGASAFPHRSAMFTFGVQAGWLDPADDEVCIAWARDLHARTARFATDGVYSNYLDRDEDDLVRAAYGTNADRLQAVKARYDPSNRFNANVNILPR